MRLAQGQVWALMADRPDQDGRDARERHGGAERARYAGIPANEKAGHCRVRASVRGLMKWVCVQPVGMYPKLPCTHHGHGWPLPSVSGYTRGTHGSRTANGPMMEASSEGPWRLAGLEVCDGLDT